MRGQVRKVNASVVLAGGEGEGQRGQGRKVNAGVGRGRDDLHKVTPQSSAVARQGAGEGTRMEGGRTGSSPHNAWFFNLGRWLYLILSKQHIFATKWEADIINVDFLAPS